jgi:predicted RNA-binding Zn-ribbon protein involved in translation (DUF1610 family)
LQTREHPAVEEFPTLLLLSAFAEIDPTMAETATKFRCPNCEAEYKVVRVEASPTHDQPLVCLSCGGPLNNREGKFGLKYFRTKRSPGQIQDRSFHMRVSQDFLDALDKWRVKQQDKPSRAEAIRRLVEIGLRAE